jgi:hypothetical protein
MKEKLTAGEVTQAVKSAVDAVLLARAYAETMRGKVNSIEASILEECPLYVSPEHAEGRADERIADPRKVWLTDLESPQYKEHLAETNKRLRAEGLKPDSMPDSHCPACVAECVQQDAEHLLIYAAAEMMDAGDGKEFHHKLVCAGMEKYRKFIELLCGLVVAMPGYRNPLTAGKIV